ncbi:MAG: Lrp/AsnC family transcriptional regulator [Rhizobiales bacterium]|nr:Lrp/AsnC family transcriptional regulator [Hyphomicrobiales bacterium]
MTALYTELECNPPLRLAEKWQRGFPLCPEPYHRIGAADDLTANEVIAMFHDLADGGGLARIGAAVRPNSVGASTLAALSAPAERLDEIAALVSAEVCVNHNYEREHPFNLWFVVTGPDRDSVAATLERIRRASGCDVIDLPLERAYHIDLGFGLSGRRRLHTEPHTPFGSADTDDLDRALLTALEDGLELVERPFLGLAATAGCTEEAALARLRRLVADGIISRFGCVLRHRRIGFSANAMAVWSVPERDADALGERLATCDAVTLCYRRAPRLPDWPYNLFAMVHGRERTAVEREIAQAARIAGLSSYPSAVLFSCRCFKQEAAHYGRPQGLAA